MSRLKVFPREELSEAQRSIYDRIASGPRGGVRGPFHAWLRNPEYLDLLERLGEFLRYRTCFPPRLSEFAILITARNWSAQYEWFAHAPHASKGGLNPSIIEDLAHRRRPAGMQPDEEAIYDFCTELHQRQSVSDATYRAALDQFGEVGLVELIGLIGHYTLVAMTLNTFELGVPEGQQPPLPV